MAAYDKINAQNLAAILAMSPEAQKIAWATLAVRRSNDYSLLYDNLTGPIGSGKPFIAHHDLNIQSGNKVVLPLLGGARRRGRQGEQDRTGHEANLIPKDFSFKVGRWWDGFAIKSVAANETVIGSGWDKNASMFLRRNLGIKKTDDMLMELLIRANERNTIRAGNKTSADLLKTADVFSTATVLRGAGVLNSLGAKPVKLGKSSAGAPIKQFMFLGTQYGFETFRNSGTYLDGLTNADNRGELNALFTGNILPWNGHSIYQWDVEDPEDLAPAGCPLLPRAFLGVAIATGTTAVDVKGGGNTTYAAETEVAFFGYFSNAEYVGCEGQKRAADVATERYLAIRNLSGADAGKILYCSFKVNDGNKITMFKRLGSSATGDQVTTLGNIPWGSGTYNGVGLTMAATVGAEITEVNSYGVPVGKVLALGEMAGVHGHGSIDGNKAIGKRTQEDWNHDMDHAIGLETVFGTRAFERIDGQVGGYSVIECALQLTGHPVVV